MKIFLSYARNNLDPVSEPMKVQQHNFLDTIAKQLKQNPGTHPKFLIDDNLEYGLDWEPQIAKYIEECDVFLILFSRLWACSDICWREYLHVKTHRPNVPVVAIWFEPVLPKLKLEFDGGDESERFETYRQEFTKLHAFLSRNQVHDLKRDLVIEGSFRERLEETSGTSDGLQGRMSKFAAPYSKMLWNAFTDAQAKQTKPVAEPETHSFVEQAFTIGAREITFVKIPVGKVDHPSLGHLTVRAPFWIMKETITARDLFAHLQQGAQPAFVFSRLVKAMRDMVGGQNCLRFATEDEWEFAHLVRQSGSIGGRETSLHSGINPRPDSAITPSPRGTHEAVLGRNKVRGSSRLTTSDRQLACFKWRTSSGFQMKDKGFDSPVGDARLRLVFLT